MLATYGGITDVAVLQAAILHDTIEDTDTAAEELEREFGPEVTALVLEMTDDMAMPSADRKRHQAARAPGLSSRAKCIKLADKIANVGDIGSQPPPDWSLERRRTYFTWTVEVIKGCRGVNEGLERRYDEVLAEAQRVTR